MSANTREELQDEVPAVVLTSQDVSLLDGSAGTREGHVMDGPDAERFYDPLDGQMKMQRL